MCFFKKMCDEASDATQYSPEDSQRCVIECLKYFMLIWSPRDDQQHTMERAAQAVHTGLGVQGSWSDVNIERKEKYRDVAKIVMKFFIDKSRDYEK
jgi:hypothetical protein